jgi:hypothetical protein
MNFIVISINCFACPLIHSSNSCVYDCAAWCMECLVLFHGLFFNDICQSCSIWRSLSFVLLAQYGGRTQEVVATYTQECSIFRQSIVSWWVYQVWKNGYMIWTLTPVLYVMHWYQVHLDHIHGHVFDAIYDVFDPHMHTTECKCRRNKVQTELLYNHFMNCVIMWSRCCYKVFIYNCCFICNKWLCGFVMLNPYYDLVYFMSLIDFEIEGSNSLLKWMYKIWYWSARYSSNYKKVYSTLVNHQSWQEGQTIIHWRNECVTDLIHEAIHKMLSRNT